MDEDHPAMKELLTADVPEGALPATTILLIRILTAGLFMAGQHCGVVFEQNRSDCSCLGDQSRPVDKSFALLVGQLD